MCQWARIFGKLVGTKEQYIFYSLYPSGIHIGRELAVAKDGKTLLQAELKPISASDPVARVIVEILMGHHRLNTLKTHIGGDIGMGEHTGCIENIEPLVFHGTHVEIIYGNDVVEV